MRGFISFFALAVIAAAVHPAAAKPLPKAYGYGRIAGAPGAVLDVRDHLPAGPDVKWTADEPKAVAVTPAAEWTSPAPASNVSCYAAEREGGLTASGEAYNGEALAAAHPDMQLSSLALVRNTANGKEIIVRVNDRPKGSGAVEFTPAAARALGIADTCAASVTVTRLGAAPYVAKAEAVTQPALNEPVAHPPISNAAYLVQVGAFAQRGNAESAREQVASAGPVSVEPAIVGGASLFRVRLGPWATREEAEQARAAAAGLGFPGAKLLLP